MSSVSTLETLRRQATRTTHRLHSLPMLVLMPHSRCNCRCVMCDIWQANANKQELSREDIEQQMGSLRSLHVQRVVLSGGEALRVLRPQGTLVILDTPMYTDPTSGARMVQERQSRFMATYGFASDALPSEHFLTPARLPELSRELNLSWQTYYPVLDWRSAFGRTLGGIRARREPARFPVILGTRP